MSSVISKIFKGKENEEDEVMLCSSMEQRTLCETTEQSIQNFTITFRDTFPSKLQSEESKRSLSQTIRSKAHTLSSYAQDHAEQLRYGGEYLNNKRKDAEAQERRDKAEKAREEAKKAEEEAEHLYQEWKTNPRCKKALQETRKFILDTYDKIGAQNPEHPDYTSLAQFVQMVIDDAIPWFSGDQENKAKIAQADRELLRAADVETQLFFRVIFSVVANNGTEHRLLSVREVIKDYRSYNKLTIQAWRVASLSKP